MTDEEIHRNVSKNVFYFYLSIYIYTHNIQTHTPLCYWLFCSFTYLISLHIYTAYIYFFFFMSYRRICFNQPKKKVKKRKKMIQLVRLVYFCWDLIYWLIYFVHKILITVPSNHTWELFWEVAFVNVKCKLKLGSQVVHKKRKSSSIGKKFAEKTYGNYEKCQILTGNLNGGIKTTYL